MKTSALMLVSTLFVANSILFTGCQKDQLPVPNNITNENSAVAAKSSNPDGKAYAVISIEHQQGLSSLPEYSVRVYNNSTAEYEGISNVAQNGLVNFQLSRDQMNKIEGLILSSTIFTLEDTVSYIPDATLNTITVTRFDDRTTELLFPNISRTYYDDNIAYPSALINLRAQIEDVLNISKYVQVKGNSRINNVKAVLPFNR